MISIIPVPDPLPMARGYFDFLLLLTFPIHLLFMNTMLAATAIAIWAHWRKDAVYERLAYQLAKALPLLIAFTINFGVPPLLFAQVIFGHYLYSSTVIMGFFWLSIIPILLVVYYGVYLYDFKFWSLGRRGIAILIGAGVLMLCVGFIFSSNMTLMLDPEAWAAYFSHDGGRFLNINDQTILPRYIHMIVGAFAVGGLGVASISRLWSGDHADEAELALTAGMRLFFIATCVQIVVGIWFLLSLPADVLMIFMGHSLLASVIFVLSLIMMFFVLKAAWNYNLAACAWMTVVLVYMMSFMRALVREAYLGKNFVEQVVAANADLTPLLLFVVTLVIGLVLIGWMLKVTFKSDER